MRSASSSGLLPLPGSASSSWVLYHDRLFRVFRSTDTSVLIAFWLFGLINNVLYVVILSAAQDLVGTDVPKGVVLVADVMPSFAAKLVGPYFIHRVTYATRIPVFVALSTVGMLLVALTPPDRFAVATKLLGVAAASLSSGAGELSFLSLTHYYGPMSLAAWSSGTGAAGLVGAGLYVVLTSWWGLGVQTSLLVPAALPVVMLVSFFAILPRAPLLGAGAGVGASKKTGPEEYEPLRGRACNHGNENNDSRDHDDQNHDQGDTNDNGDDGDDCDDDNAQCNETDNLTGPRSRSGASTPAYPHRHSATTPSSLSSSLLPSSLAAKLQRTRHLFIPYMLPLLLVYVAEYTINQGVTPTLLFPPSSFPAFLPRHRDFYPFYGFLYQLGVFASRSSAPWLRIRQLYVPALLQVGNLVLLTGQALSAFLPSPYWVFVVVLWEGLLGGAVYVNTFAEILDRVPVEEREFSLGATTVSDSAGICLAGFVSMAMEMALCNWQVRRGREWCRKLDMSKGGRTTT